MKHRVLIDMDGVTVNFTEKLIRDMNEKLSEYGTFTEDQINHFQVKKSFPHIPARKIWGVMESPGFFADMHPIDGALDGIETLMDDPELDVFICSAPLVKNPTCAQDKFDWITRHLGRSMAKRTILSVDKTIVHGSVLVDDKEVITGVQNPVWEHILFAHRHNSSNTRKPRMTWDTLYMVYDVIDQKAQAVA